MNKKIDKTKEFAKELKVLSMKYRIGVLEARFNLLIEDHSKTHARVFTYKSATENDGIESSQLFTEEVISI
jgi:hypothetical protein